MVNATLMNIADSPTNVQLPGVYNKEEIPRVPIICTGALQAQTDSFQNNLCGHQVALAWLHSGMIYSAGRPLHFTN